MPTMNAVQLAMLVSGVGVLLASMAPTFIRDLHASRVTEAVEGISTIAANAVAYASDKDLPASFPSPAPLTPADVPRGVRIVDPPGTWEHPTWKTLHFEMTLPHRFSYAFDVSSDPARIWFQARAHGDLNGDGVTSTFEVSGERRPGASAVLVPGMKINREVE